MSLTQLLNHNANGVTYANPADPDYTVRFKTTSSKKTVAGSILQNSVSEIIVNDSHNITVGSNSVTDNLSVRVRISGSLESRARLSEILASLAGQITTWDSENVFIGFEPTTVPLVPGV